MYAFNRKERKGIAEDAKKKPLKNTFLFILFFQIIIACSSNNFKNESDEAIIDRFRSLPYETIKNLNNDDSYFIMSHNNHDELFEYPSLEEIIFLFNFDEDSILIQGFSSSKQLDDLKITKEVLPELTNENLMQYKLQTIKPFTTEKGEIVKLQDTEISEYYFNFERNEFLKIIRGIDLNSFESMKNVNAEHNLSLTFLDFDQSVKSLLYLYFLELEKNN